MADVKETNMKQPSQSDVTDEMVQAGVSALEYAGIDLGTYRWEKIDEGMRHAFVEMWKIKMGIQEHQALPTSRP